MIAYWMRYRDIPQRELGPARPGWQPSPPPWQDSSSVAVPGLIQMPRILPPAQQIYGQPTDRYIEGAPQIGPVGEASNRERTGYSPTTAGGPVNVGASIGGIAGGAGRGQQIDPRTGQPIGGGGGVPRGILPGVGSFFGPIGRIIGTILDILIAPSRRDSTPLPGLPGVPGAYADPDDFIGASGFSSNALYAGDPVIFSGVIGDDPDQPLSLADILGEPSTTEVDASAILPGDVDVSQPGDLPAQLDTEHDTPLAGADTFTPETIGIELPDGFGGPS